MENLLPFVCDVVVPGTLVCTDGWGGYNDLPKHGYKHEKTVQSSSGDPGSDMGKASTFVGPPFPR